MSTQLETLRWSPRKMGRTARLRQFMAEHPDAVDAGTVIRQNPQHTLRGVAPDSEPVEIQELRAIVDCWNAPPPDYEEFTTT